MNSCDLACDNFEISNWIPIEGIPREKRDGPNTIFSGRRADHRNSILKDWAKRLEAIIEPKVPIDYVCPFDKNKCVYCLSANIGKSGDEFRPATQRGRYNIVNCLPCCGSCNSSKQDKCGLSLIKWIKDESSKKRSYIIPEQQEKIINWYKKNEEYLIIPLDTLDTKDNKTYENKLAELDSNLNKMYIEFS